MPVVKLSAWLYRMLKQPRLFPASNQRFPFRLSLIFILTSDWPLPLSGPVIATVAILTFLPMWNAYLWPLMSVQTDAVRPIMVGVSFFAGYGVSGPSLALLTLAALPVLALFLLLQRQFVQSIAATGLKG